VHVYFCVSVMFIACFGSDYTTDQSNREYLSAVLYFSDCFITGLLTALYSTQTGKIYHRLHVVWRPNNEVESSHVTCGKPTPTSCPLVTLSTHLSWTRELGLSNPISRPLCHLNSIFTVQCRNLPVVCPHRASHFTT
jgi:hypothetical protein